MKKSTLEVDENDILKMSEKIKQNERENILFSEQVNQFIDGRLSNFETLSLGHTPNILYLVGAQAHTLTIKQSVLRNCMLPADKHTSDHSMGHDISANIIKKLPESIRNSILVLEGQHPKTVVVLTELKNKDDKNVIVPIALDLRSTDSTVNKITSVYGKNHIRSYLEKHQSQIIAYNKEKTDRLFTTIGYRLPKTTSAICFDNSIAYSLQNVKGKRRDFIMSNKKDVSNKIYEEFNEFEKNFLDQKQKPTSLENEYSDKKSIVECLKESDGIKLPENAEEADNFDFSRVVTFPKEELITALKPSSLSLDNIFSHLSINEDEEVTAQDITNAMNGIVEEEFSAETLQLLDSTFYFPEAEQISKRFTVEQLENMPSDVKQQLINEICETWSKFCESLPELPEDPNDVWQLKQLPDELHNSMMNIYDKAEASIVNNPAEKEKAERRQETKVFTFSRKQLNDNANKVKEQPSEQRSRDKKPPEHGSL